MVEVTPQWDDPDVVGRAYAEHLTDADLRALVGADRVGDGEAAARVEALRREPSLVLDALDRPETTARLLGLDGSRHRPRLAFVSPFLLFAAAIHRTAADLLGLTYTPERTSPRLRVPLFDSVELAAYLAVPRRRLFLAELLASFVRHSGGYILTMTPRGPRRRRWDEMDLDRLAVLLEAVPTSQRPGVWRRLGDLSLLLAGVFADAAEVNAPNPLHASELALRTGISSMAPDGTASELLEWLGVGWYRLAARSVVAAVDHHPLSDALVDSAEHFHQARRVLNTATDRYLFPITTGWFTPPGPSAAG